MFTETKECRICKRGLTDIINLGDQALASTFPKEGEPDPPIVPLILSKCNNEECNLVQLKHTVDNSEMYEKTYGYRSGINQTMRDHLANLAKQIESKVNIEDADIIIDIGSNDATLLKSFKNNNATKVGIDPTGSQFEEYYTDDIKLFPTYFKEGVFEGKAKSITSISMFYDLPDPVQFMKDIKQNLAEGGLWTMEQSYMPSMLKLNSYDTVCHEHLEYYSLGNIQYMCKLADLEIVDVEFNPCNGGSFRVFISHPGAFKVVTERVNTVLDAEKEMKLHTLEIYSDFQQRCDKTKQELVSFIKGEKEKGSEIYIYGASTKGNTLLQYCGIDNKMITAAAERNPNKYGCRTPLTNIPIISEAEMRSKNPDFLLVLPWHFKDEFVKREQDYIKKGGQLIFPLPVFDIEQ